MKKKNLLMDENNSKKKTIMAQKQCIYKYKDTL